jgi:hypothetical protein
MTGYGMISTLSPCQSALGGGVRVGRSVNIDKHTEATQVDFFSILADAQRR